MPGDRPQRETGVRRLLGLVTRGAAIGAFLGWLVIVLAADVMVFIDLVSRGRKGDILSPGSRPRVAVSSARVIPTVPFPPGPLSSPAQDPEQALPLFDPFR